MTTDLRPSAIHLAPPVNQRNQAVSFVSPWPATSNSPFFSRAPYQGSTGQMSAMTVFIEEVQQLRRWKTWRKMLYARRCDRAAPAATGQEQNSYTSKRELDRKYFMEMQGFCPHPKGFRKLTRTLTER